MKTKEPAIDKLSAYSKASASEMPWTSQIAHQKRINQPLKRQVTYNKRTRLHKALMLASG